MTSTPQLALPALPRHELHVASLQGREALSAPFRFDVEVTSEESALPLDDIVGEEAVLTIADRRVVGVVLEMVQRGVRDGAYVYELTLVPRLSLLSLGKMSRVYQQLTVPEIVSAVLASTGTQVLVEERLQRSYPRRVSVMQYAESPLAFVSRLLEHEGIAYRIRRDEVGERLVLSDDNAAYDEVALASMDASTEGGLSAFACRRRLVPRRVLVQDHDPARPDMPLQALAEVDAAGFGIDVMQGAGFQLAERGAELAKMRAEALRGEATRYEGSGGRPLVAGTRLRLDGHFRADFDGDYLVVDVVHAFDGARYTCRFEALALALAFRPPLATPRPRIDGVLAARVDAIGPDAEAATDEHGNYRVTLPCDSSGALAGGGSGPVSLLSPDEGSRFQLRRGAPVVLSFLGGDPDRPVISGAVPAERTRTAAGTNVIRTPQGGIIEMSGKYARPPAGDVRDVRGELAREQQLSGDDDWTETNDDSADNDWVRFAVPHAGGWSYLRYGARTTTGVNAGAGENTHTEFKETEFVDPKHKYNSKYIDGDGETVGSGDKGFEWKWGDLDSSDFHTNMASSEQSKGGKSFFGHDASDGVYDYTDGNRTVITQGSQQTVTVGHRTDVVLGDYRLIIPKRTNGVFDADVYGMRYRKQAGHWRKTEWSHVASDSYAWGDTESFFWGTSFALTGGINASGFLGGKLDATLAMSATVNIGAAVEASIGDKLVYTKGDERSSSSTNLVSAQKTITFAIGKQTWSRSWIEPVFGSAAAILGVAGTVGGMVNFDNDNPNTSLISSAVLGGLALVSAGVLATKMLVDDAKDPVGYPRMVMDKDAGVKMEVSADNTLLFNDKGLLIQVGGAAGCVIEVTTNGIFMKSKGNSALLIGGDGAACLTAKGDGLSGDSDVSDAGYPIVGVDGVTAALAFNDATGVSVTSAGVENIE